MHYALNGMHTKLTGKHYLINNSAFYTVIEFKQNDCYNIIFYRIVYVRTQPIEVT